MSHPAVDEAAWTNRWRHRSTAEKALLALGLLALAVTTSRVAVAGTITAVAACCAVLGARVAPRIYLRAVTAPALFVVLAGLSVAVTVGNPVDAWWSWGPVSVTPDGRDRAVLAASRALAAMASVMVLATTTPMVDVLEGLRRLRMPDVVIDLAGLTYRLIFTGLTAVLAVREAQHARLGYASGVAARRSLAGLGAAALSRTWTQARRLEDGLAGRGYTTSLRTLAAPQQVSRPFMVTTLLLLSALATWSFAPC